MDRAVLTVVLPHRVEVRGACPGGGTGRRRGGEEPLPELRQGAGVDRAVLSLVLPHPGEVPLSRFLSPPGVRGPCASPNSSPSSAARGTTTRASSSRRGTRRTSSTGRLWTPA